MKYIDLIEHLYNWNGTMLIQYKNSYGYYELIAIKRNSKCTLGFLNMEEILVIDSEIDVNENINLEALASKIDAVKVEIDCRKVFEIIK